MNKRISGPIALGIAAASGRRPDSFTHIFVAILLSTGLFAGCTADAPPSAAEASAGPDLATTPTTTATATDGVITVSINGDIKTFDKVLADHTYYTRLASQLTAEASGEANTRLRITFASINLKDFDYPAELPPPKDFSKPMDPMTAGAMIGFGFIDKDGTEWSGPGKIHVESYESDGVISGSFADVSIPHTEKALPNAVLTEGKFRVRISDFW